jgi:hypothetical protein
MFSTVVVFANAIDAFKLFIMVYYYHVVSLSEPQLATRPWQQEQWTEIIRSWLAAVLQADVSLNQVRSTDLTFGAVVQLREERYFFKAGDHTREAKVTAYLAKASPQSRCG